MKNFRNKEALYRISKDLKELYSLHKIQQEALYNCYDENRDYGHIFAIDTIYDEKFQKILSNFKQAIKI